LPPPAARVPRPAQARQDLIVGAAKGKAPARMAGVAPVVGAVIAKCLIEGGIGGCGPEADPCANSGRVRTGSVIEGILIRMARSYTKRLQLTGLFMCILHNFFWKLFGENESTPDQYATATVH